MALHPVPERVAEVDALLVGQPELFRELVDTQLCQDDPFVVCRSMSVFVVFSVIRAVCARPDTTRPETRVSSPAGRGGPRRRPSIQARIGPGIEPRTSQHRPTRPDRAVILARTGVRTPTPSAQEVRSENSPDARMRSTSTVPNGARSARASATTALRSPTHAGPGHSHAPRPGPGPVEPSARTRISSEAAARRRHTTQVRTGPDRPDGLRRDPRRCLPRRGRRRQRPPARPPPPRRRPPRARPPPRRPRRPRSRR